MVEAEMSPDRHLDALEVVYAEAGAAQVAA